MEIPNPSTEYLAGLFDADGTLSIIRARRGGTVRHQLSVALTNCCAPVVFAFRERYGGGVIRKTLPSTAANGQRDTYEWHAMARIAAAFLSDIHQHLIVKRAEAEVALEFQSRIRSDRRQRIGAEELERRDALADECARLKRVRYDRNSIPVAHSTIVVPPPQRRWNKTARH